MSPKFSDQTIERVRFANDIVEVISNYMTLKRSGKRFIGNCPFHHETKPSFTVDPEKQLFHCFGCKKGGTVFNFIMEIEKLTFPEALRFLAERAGIALDESPRNLQLEKEKEALFHINRWAANYFYKNLFTQAGKVGLDYIRKRGISDAMIKKFGLGYSLPAWDGLIKQAQKEQISLEILKKAGLIIEKNNGGYYDRFRGRFMIPIVNLNKKVLGFGGRTITDDPDQPKYINSPETPIYQKGTVLFGLYQSRDAIQKLDQVIFVEGYTDLIALFQNGIENVVATSGTALTPFQIKLIKRFTQNVIMLFDADSAGSTAAVRGAELFLDEGIDVSIVTLPPGLDPDNFIQTHGADQFRELIKQAMSLTQFKINLLLQKFDRNTTQGMSQIITDLLSSTIRIKDPVKQNLTIKEIAEYFALDEMALIQKANMMKSGQRRIIVEPDTGDEQIPSEKVTQKTKYDLAERDLLRLTFQNINWIGYIFNYLEMEEISNVDYQELFSHLYHIYSSYEFIESNDIANLVSDPNLTPLISDFLNDPLPDDTDQMKLFMDCVGALKKKSFEKELKEITRQIKIAESSGQDTMNLMKKYKELRELIASIENGSFFDIFEE